MTVAAQKFDTGLEFQIGTREPLIGLATLAQMAFRGLDMAPLRQKLLNRVTADPHDAEAMMDLATVLQLTGRAEDGLTAQHHAVVHQQLYHVPGQGAAAQPRLRLLVLKTPGDLMANTPVEFLLKGTPVSLDLMYMTLETGFPAEIPDHDVLFLAIGESEANLPLLRWLEPALASWPRPVVNRPARIAPLSRDGSWALLRDVPGLRMPEPMRRSRAELEVAGAALSLTFPLIVRPSWSHAGIGLEKIDSACDLVRYLSERTEQEFFLTRFVDYRSDDEQYRKYRIAVIDGQPFACHYAVSDHWMVHYLSAGMAASAEKRAEEANVMAYFDQDFARRHGAAFAAMTQRLGLRYYGLDAAETADGELLVFEVDTAMIVHDMDPPALFPYKGPQMRRIFAAFAAMLANAADGR